jgi:glycosyltransferase involved in cell wall biosynthesis
VYATKLDPDACGVDSDAVEWSQAEELPTSIRFASPDVFCALRSSAPYQIEIPAALNVLWNQDLLIHAEQVVGAVAQIDKMVYVSEFHRRQWKGVAETLQNVDSWIFRNGVDLQLAEARRQAFDEIPPRFIHVSRPERGHDGLIQIWPKIRERWPEATLQICRYSSMYDAEGFGKVCDHYDDLMRQLDEQTGGIEWLGELSKAELYDAISASSVMIYPTSQKDFAETGCFAATESIACGTPFVGDARGALP